jgi:lipopolysaccharide transport system permease protein/teichoic acid transport system permease protein
MGRYVEELYKRRDLFVYLVASGLKAQHRNSFLGYFWWLLDPLLDVAVYYVLVVLVFHRGGDDYGMYLIVGMVVWRWVSSTVSGAARSIIAQAGVISQVYLPKLIFPLSATLTQLIHFGFGLLVVALGLVFFHIAPTTALFWLPYVIVMQLLFLAALAVTLAYLCVFIRDIDNLIGPMLRVWFFTSPVIWREDMVTEGHRWLVGLNPMTHFLASYRSMFLSQSSPNGLPLLEIGLGSLLWIAGVTYYYSRFEHEIVKAL